MFSVRPVIFSSVSLIHFPTSLPFLFSRSCNTQERSQNLYCGTGFAITYTVKGHWMQNIRLPCDKKKSKNSFWNFILVNLYCCVHYVNIPLDFPFLSPTRPSHVSCIQKCHTHGTQIFCPVYSNKPEAFYGAHTAVWLLLLQFPFDMTLYKWGCLQPQSGQTWRHYASVWVWCQTWSCKWDTEVYQIRSWCPSTY